MIIVRAEDEINEVLNWAAKGEDEGSKFPGASFEEGVRAAIEWITGQSDNRPDQE